ncbi:MAG: tetraacyldisaccharide 4'-kinase [Muribaculaceae bacterium]|nr:tetraacyldisaccharide 4'-kinase [Muribaculaceae bacterium]
MAVNPLVANLALRPISWIYGAVAATRNHLFKWGVLKQQTFNVPIIVVGNIAVGGTGKTPHTEFIVEIMRHKYKVAVVSRGYKRSTSGFVLASRRSSPLDIGDEPYQIYHKFDGKVPVAVCESRTKGIEKLLSLNPEINLIVLDDAFQHRYVKPTVSIVLTEFGRPAFSDKLLPLGRLREPFSAIYRADMVIVTKCPPDIRPLQYRLYKENLQLIAFQKLYFSSYLYGELTPVFPDDVNMSELPRMKWLTENDSILALAGIAHPRPFAKWLRRHKAKVKLRSFPDHHNFQRRDLDTIYDLYRDLPGSGKKIIVTTEKDAVRLANNPYYPPELKRVTFYIPIRVRMDQWHSQSFASDLDKMITQAINSQQLSQQST